MSIGNGSLKSKQKQRIRQSYARQLRAEEAEGTDTASPFGETSNREISGKWRTVFGTGRQSDIQSKEPGVGWIFSRMTFMQMRRKVLTGHHDTQRKILEKLARAKERRAALDAKIEELEQKLIEAENAEILGIVRDANLSAEELSRIMAYAKKAMASKNKEE